MCSKNEIFRDHEGNSIKNENAEICKVEEQIIKKLNVVPMTA